LETFRIGNRKHPWKWSLPFSRLKIGCLFNLADDYKKKKDTIIKIRKNARKTNKLANASKVGDFLERQRCGNDLFPLLRRRVARNNSIAKMCKNPNSKQTQKMDGWVVVRGEGGEKRKE